jgi:ABC-type dipeptide/oligopeptide/nickel transport system permease subunit
MSARDAILAAARGRSLLVGALLTLVFTGAALVSLAWTPYDITALDIANKMTLPAPAHPLGTDHFGRDILSMIMVGARTSIAVALVAVGIGMGLGVPLGLAAVLMPLILGGSLIQIVGGVVVGLALIAFSLPRGRVRQNYGASQVMIL